MDNQGVTTRVGWRRSHQRYGAIRGEVAAYYCRFVVIINRCVRSSTRRQSNRSDEMWTDFAGQSAVSRVRAEGQWTTADRQWTVPDRAAQLLRRGQLVHDDSERPAALELRRTQRATDEPVVGLLRDARDRPGQRRNVALAADSDGAELHRGAEQYRAVHALDVHEPLTAAFDAASAHRG